jgi:hypothetical protein
MDAPEEFGLLLQEISVILAELSKNTDRTTQVFKVP